MEEEYGYKGREGDASITLYRDEVDMTLPHSHLNLSQSLKQLQYYSEDFKDTVNLFRGGDVTPKLYFVEMTLVICSPFMHLLRGMNYVTMENDDSYLVKIFLLGLKMMEDR